MRKHIAYWADQVGKAGFSGATWVCIMWAFDRAPTLTYAGSLLALGIVAAIVWVFADAGTEPLSEEQEK